jgi:hypothetical protein
MNIQEKPNMTFSITSNRVTLIITTICIVIAVFCAGMLFEKYLHEFTDYELMIIELMINSPDTTESADINESEEEDGGIMSCSKETEC